MDHRLLCPINPEEQFNIAITKLTPIPTPLPQSATHLQQSATIITNTTNPTKWIVLVYESHDFGTTWDVVSTSPPSSTPTNIPHISPLFPRSPPSTKQHYDKNNSHTIQSTSISTSPTRQQQVTWSTDDDDMIPYIWNMSHSTLLKFEIRPLAPPQHCCALLITPVAELLKNQGIETEYQLMDMNGLPIPSKLSLNIKMPHYNDIPNNLAVSLSLQIDNVPSYGFLRGSPSFVLEIVRNIQLNNNVPAGSYSKNLTQNSIIFQNPNIDQNDVIYRSPLTISAHSQIYNNIIIPLEVLTGVGDGIEKFFEIRVMYAESKKIDKKIDCLSNMAGFYILSLHQLLTCTGNEFKFSFKNPQKQGKITKMNCAIDLSVLKVRKIPPISKYILGNDLITVPITYSLDITGINYQHNNNTNGNNNNNNNNTSHNNSLLDVKNRFLEIIQFTTEIFSPLTRDQHHPITFITESNYGQFELSVPPFKTINQPQNISQKFAYKHHPQLVSTFFTHFPTLDIINQHQNNNIPTHILTNTTIRTPLSPTTGSKRDLHASSLSSSLTTPNSPSVHSISHFDSTNSHDFTTHFPKILSKWSQSYQSVSTNMNIYHGYTNKGVRTIKWSKNGIFPINIILLTSNLTESILTYLLDNVIDHCVILIGDISHLETYTQLSQLTTIQNHPNFNTYVQFMTWDNTCQGVEFVRQNQIKFRPILRQIYQNWLSFFITPKPTQIDSFLYLHQLDDAMIVNGYPNLCDQRKDIEQKVQFHDELIQFVFFDFKIQFNTPTNNTNTNNSTPSQQSTTITTQSNDTSQQQQQYPTTLNGAQYYLTIRTISTDLNQVGSWDDETSSSIRNWPHKTIEVASTQQLLSPHQSLFEPCTIPWSPTSSVLFLVMLWCIPIGIDLHDKHNHIPIGVSQPADFSLMISATGIDSKQFSSFELKFGQCDVNLPIFPSFARQLPTIENASVRISLHRPAELCGGAIGLGKLLQNDDVINYYYNYLDMIEMTQENDNNENNGCNSNNGSKNGTKKEDDDTTDENDSKVNENDDGKCNDEPKVSNNTTDGQSNNNTTTTTTESNIETTPKLIQSQQQSISTPQPPPQDLGLSVTLCPIIIFEPPQILFENMTTLTTLIHIEKNDYATNISLSKAPTPTHELIDFFGMKFQGIDIVRISDQKIVYRSPRYLIDQHGKRSQTRLLPRIVLNLNDLLSYIENNDEIEYEQQCGDDNSPSTQDEISIEQQQQHLPHQQQQQVQLQGNNNQTQYKASSRATNSTGNSTSNNNTGPINSNTTKNNQNQEEKQQQQQHQQQQHNIYDQSPRQSVSDIYNPYSLSNRSYLDIEFEIKHYIYDHFDHKFQHYNSSIKTTLRDIMSLPLQLKSATPTFNFNDQTHFSSFPTHLLHLEPFAQNHALWLHLKQFECNYNTSKSFNGKCKNNNNNNHNNNQNETQSHCLITNDINQSMIIIPNEFIDINKKANHSVIYSNDEQTGNNTCTPMKQINKIVQITYPPPKISFITVSIGSIPSISADFLGSRVMQPQLLYSPALPLLTSPFMKNNRSTNNNQNKTNNSGNSNNNVQQYYFKQQEEYEKYHLVPTFSIDYGLPHDTEIPIYVYPNYNNNNNNNNNNYNGDNIITSGPQLQKVKLHHIIDDVITWFNLFLDPHGGGRLTTTITGFGEYIPFESILDYRYKIAIGVRQRGSKTPHLNLQPRLAPFNNHLNQNNQNNNNNNNNNSNSTELLEHQTKRNEYLQNRKLQYQQLLQQKENDKNGFIGKVVNPLHFQLNLNESNGNNSGSYNTNLRSSSTDIYQTTSPTTSLTLISPKLSSTEQQLSNHNRANSASNMNVHNLPHSTDNNNQNKKNNKNINSIDSNETSSSTSSSSFNLDNDTSFKDLAGAISITSGLAVYSLGSIPTTKSTPLLDQNEYNNDYVQISRSLYGGHHIHICIVATPFRSEYKHELRTIISESNQFDITIIFICVHSEYTSKWLKVGKKHFYNDICEPQNGHKIHFATSWELGRGHIIVQEILNKVYKRIHDQIGPLPLVSIQSQSQQQQQQQQQQPYQ